MMRAVVRGASVRGPGLPGWEAACAVLNGSRALPGDDLVLPPPAMLPPNERRRAGIPTRLAFAVAEEAVAAAGIAPAALRCVFASANGEAAVLHSILEAMCAPQVQLSPTQFHNSVHNAVAGYWSIGTGSSRPATCLGGYDDSFAAGLLKAAAEVTAEAEPVLLCAYDAPFPGPIGALRRTGAPFAAALVLAPTGEGLADIALDYDAAPAEEAGEPHDAALVALCRANPAARSLRLLQALAHGTEDRFALALHGGSVRIHVHPRLGACPFASAT